jgi:hypothetical protein
VEEGHFVSCGAKSWPLIWLEKNLIVSLKWLSWAIRFVVEKVWSGWQLWSGATIIVVSIGHNRPRWGVVICQVIVCVKILFNLVEKWSIKRVGKEATKVAFGEKLRNKMNSQPQNSTVLVKFMLVLISLPIFWVIPQILLSFQIIYIKNKD